MVFKNVAMEQDHPLWIEGRNAPCDGAIFDNVSVVDRSATVVPRTAVKFMADVRNMVGEIGVQSPHCQPQVAPAGNSLLIRCASG